jgi:magnesium transporter
MSAPPPMVEQEQVVPGELPKITPELVENVSEWLDAQEQDRALKVLDDLHPSDLAELLMHLAVDESKQVLNLLPAERGGDILAQLKDNFRAELLKEELPMRITALLDQLDTDDIVDVLATLPREVVEKVLPALTHAKDVKHLLGYDEDSAGGIMGTEYVAVPSIWTVAQATEEVRRQAEAVHEIFAVFVVDAQGHLEGSVTLKRLLLSPAHVRMLDIMDPDVQAVDTDLDQEEVARIMERYDLVALPVVDSKRCLIGCITIDDVVDVIREEAEEDIQRMSGVSAGVEPTDSIMRMVAGRLPWLLAGLLGASLSGLVIGTFESAIQQAVILAGFIPIVMATAGNAGIQSSAIAVQGLASGELWATDMARQLVTEITVSAVNGVATAMILGLVVLLASTVVAIDNPMRLALTAGVALLVVVILAATIGATVPLLLHRFGIDPALATGPFITTSNDMLGVLVFFVLASMIYLA